MSDILKNKVNSETPQCQYFVMRKKRLCRMTVRPGRQFCGEHEPEPRKENGKDDTRIPCPNDQKHTCYASKLEKHLSICNARQTSAPVYIQHDVNIPPPRAVAERRPLSDIPVETVKIVIDKVNRLYDEHISGTILEPPYQGIHSAVSAEFHEANRAEASRRHLRQAGRILTLAEDVGLVNDDSCYVELGAGKGQLSYYMGTSWCSQHQSRVVAVDRAALRHKRDNKLTLPQEMFVRIRADLAHLALHQVPQVADSQHVVGFAKHLCGVATDYALWCLTSESVRPKTRGGVLATCCHHRCELTAYVGTTQLMELGLTEDDINVMLGIVSWATCGDGCSRELRKQIADKNKHVENKVNRDSDNVNIESDKVNIESDHVNIESDKVNIESDNVNIESDKVNVESDKVNIESDHVNLGSNNVNIVSDNVIIESDHVDLESDNVNIDSDKLEYFMNKSASVSSRAEIGRRAKLLLDYGRVLWLRTRGFYAVLVRYVDASVSPENICLVITDRECKELLSNL